MSDWQSTCVAPRGTHHLLAGVPLYDARFDEVLAFHAPGLAPVRMGECAWHIDLRGKPAYTARFRRTFGFYQERAAVVGDHGWHHVWPDGRPLYEPRHDWCGNYQGGRCTVRARDGAYFHIDLEGRPSYVARWRYAGDYRDGLAAVQREDGRSSHIDLCGELVHGRWFLDLDVFHKGLARARDERGWMHVDGRGCPVYQRRFAMIEPFYNGQARVETFDGALAVIAENGETLVVLRPPARSVFADLSADLVGYWKTQTITAAVELGVLDALPATLAELAAACDLPAIGARRLFCALGELGLVERTCEPGDEPTREPGNELWRVTARGSLLRSDHRLTLADAAIEYGRQLQRDWEALPRALRGRDWQPPDVFGMAGADSARCTALHRMLRSYALHDYEAVIPLLGLQHNETVIDAGGGTGTLASLVLAHYPEVQVVVLERPEIAARVPVAAYPERLQAVAASLFEPWPLSGDTILLARVLHDWDDADAVRILTHARTALRPGGRILIMEMLLSEDHFGGSLCDLHLLAVTGGRERTAAELDRVLRDAGLHLIEARHTPSLPHLIEARPA